MKFMNATSIQTLNRPVEWERANFLLTLSFIAEMLMKSLTFFGIGRSRTPLKTQVYRNNALASRHSFFCEVRQGL